MIISIDQSLTCSGITVWDNDSLVGFTTIKPPQKIEQIEKLVYVQKKFTALLYTYEPEMIIFEGLAFAAKGTSARILAAVLYSMQSICKKEGIPYITYTPNQAKKTATGKGSADKEAMIFALPDDILTKFTGLGYTNSSSYKTGGLSDLADSYWLYQTYKDQNGN